MPDGKLLDNLAGHDRAVRSVAFSSKGQMLASGSADQTIKLWEMPDNLAVPLRAAKSKDNLSEKP
jgi:WD40 repeat protein